MNQYFLKVLPLMVLSFGVQSIGYAASSADIAIAITAPVNEMVNVANPYSIRVANNGNKDAAAVNLAINLAVTHTSPQVLLMGAISQLDARCTRQQAVINCNLGIIKRGKNTLVNFAYSIPVSNDSIFIHAQATLNGNDSNANNNLFHYIPALKFNHYAIVGQIAANNSHCTGTNLVSYFECLAFPSSIAQHQAVFEADGTITFPNAPSYYGFWQQSPTQTDQLAFQYWENGSKIAEFTGFGSQANCFDGITNFLPTSNYVSPYRVCF